MIDLSTEYMGLKLKNPLIAASSGLTGTLDGIKTLEKNGVAAVVLKSIFEEDIKIEDDLGKYLELITEAKKAIPIPVIGSINCISHEDWVHYTKTFEDAGADALELNLFLNPADTENKEFEKAYFKIIEKVLAQVTIPVAIKITKYFTRLRLSVKALSESGVSAIVMFNRFYSPDIDIDKIALASGNIFTSPEEQLETLRWIAIMSNHVDCELAASTGIHTGTDMIKMLLAGATVTQVASTLYKNGPDQITRILRKLTKWMNDKGFDSVSQFRGKVSKSYEVNPTAFERMQFIKYYKEIR